ncbi:MAG TPA: hypothetical protein VMW10_07245 [Alphaproteobacteria bacterium]|nr:hypothetical protein [Alphaproteobacteria bacterium]
MTQMKIVLGLLAIFSCSQQALGANIASKSPEAGSFTAYCPALPDLKLASDPLKFSLLLGVNAKFDSVNIDVEKQRVNCIYELSRSKITATTSIKPYNVSKCYVGEEGQTECKNDRSSDSTKCPIVCPTYR